MVKKDNDHNYLQIMSKEDKGEISRLLKLVPFKLATF